MPQVKAKYQVLVSKNSYDEVKEEVESYDVIDIETPITADNYDASNYYYTKCTCFHGKKKKEVVKYDTKKE